MATFYKPVNSPTLDINDPRHKTGTNPSGLQTQSGTGTTAATGPALPIKGVTGPVNPVLPMFDPVKQVADDRAAGLAMADKEGIGKEGSLGRMTDSRAADMQALLDRLKAGSIEGMSPAEMQAAREQGISGINQQLATNMHAFGNIAAAHGIRGGSAAGLQMRALGDAQSASGDLQRKLILDNLGQKNLMTDRYGNTLRGQQGVELGIQDFNLGKLGQEKAAREAAIGGFSSSIDSARSGNTANQFNQQQIDLAKEFIKTSAANSAAKPGTATPEDKAVAKSVDTRIKGLTDSINGKATGPGLNDELAKISKIEQAMLEAAPTKYPNMSESERTYQVKIDAMNAFREAYKAKGGDIGALDSLLALSNPDYKQAITAEQTKNGGGGKIICTEAYRQKLISKTQWEVTQRYRRLLTMREYKGYLVWATPVVARMCRDAHFAQRLAPFIRKMIVAEQYALGEVSHVTISERCVGYLVKALNYGAALLRSFRLSFAKKELVHVR